MYSRTLTVTRKQKVSYVDLSLSFVKTDNTINEEKWEKKEKLLIQHKCNVQLIKQNYWKFSFMLS